MTDEGYRCCGCGQEDCDSHNEYRYGDKWYTDRELDEAGIEETCDEERRICGETGEPAESHMIWSTEDMR